LLVPTYTILLEEATRSTVGHAEVMLVEPFLVLFKDAITVLLASAFTKLFNHLIERRNTSFISGI